MYSNTKISNTESSNELLECFDDNGNAIQPKNRQKIHTMPPSVWHGVASVWLFNSKGKILCSKRSDKLSGNPGKWQTYFGGHVKADNNFLQTAQRELEEEVELDLPSDNFKLVDSGKRQDVMHIYKMYAVLFEDDLSKLKFTDGEVVETKWLAFDDYLSDRNSSPNKWCNSINKAQHSKALAALRLN